MSGSLLGATMLNSLKQTMKKQGAIARRQDSVICQLKRRRRFHKTPQFPYYKLCRVDVAQKAHLLVITSNDINEEDDDLSHYHNREQT